MPCYLLGANFWADLVAHFVNNNGIITYLPVAGRFWPTRGPDDQFAALLVGRK